MGLVLLFGDKTGFFGKREKINGPSTVKGNNTNYTPQYRYCCFPLTIYYNSNNLLSIISTVISTVVEERKKAVLGNRAGKEPLNSTNPKAVLLVLRILRSLVLPGGPFP